MLGYQRSMEYIPLIYHLYIANWIIICYLPPLKWNQETSIFRGLRGLHGSGRASEASGGDEATSIFTGGKTGGPGGG